MIRLGIIHIDEIVSYGGGQVFTDDHGQTGNDTRKKIDGREAGHG
jgi:hypothetical protein